VALEVDVPDGLPAAELDPDLIAQVLTNLVANALAVVARPGGRVAVACRVEGETVVYRVRDNGPGIPAEIRERLFEPRVGVRPGGSGLGLAVARQIVTAHGGRIGFESVPGETCFTVRLPRAAAGRAP
jgi:signal transduction histidine kinase